MDRQDWALLFSFVAMLLIAVSYFVKNKSGFLLFQSSGIFCLMISYFFNAQYFAMIGLGIGLFRSLLFYAYERKGKEASVWWCFGLCLLSFVVYGIVNLGILKSFHPADVVYLIGLVLYMFVFRIRSLKLVRFTILLPTALSIVYNVWAASPVFAVVSYCFEMTANILSIFKYHVFGKSTPENSKKSEQ
jgi:Flp pilus assembly protein TadB